MKSIGSTGIMSETPVPIPHVPSGPSATSLQNASASHRASAAQSSVPSAGSAQPGQLGHSAQPGAAPPQTPQSQSGSLPAQTPTYVPASASPPKTTPKSTLKALPTVRDHTTDQLGPGGDEYLPREIDEAGEKKVMPNGQLLGGRQYRCRTFLVPHRGDKLFMLATECARVLSYRDSYLLFNKNRSLYKIIASQVEKDDLVAQEILPFSYRSRQIAIVTARSMFRQFGSRMIEGGRRVRDDYWETKARKQGFTEADPAGEKRPGASKARAEAVEASQAAPAILGGPHGEIIYNNAPAQFGAPHPNLMPGMIGSPAAGPTRMPMITTVGPDYTENRTNRGEYAAILKTGPRQEITGPAYQDRTQPTPMPEIHAQAHHAAEFNRSVNQQRDMRNDYMQTMWRRPHEQPASASLSQPVGTDASVPASRPAPSPHTAAGMQQSGIVPNQSPQMLMTAAPYSQSIHAQNPVNPSSISRGMSTPFPNHAQKKNNPFPPPQKSRDQRECVLSGASGSLPQSSQNYNYQQGQIWPSTPQTPQHGYSAYTTQSQQSGHAQQSPTAQQMRHSSTGSQVGPGSMPYSGMPGMGQSYGTPSQGMYSADQTPRGYMHQSAAAAPAVTQAWSQQQTPGQWWPNQPQ